VGSRDSEAFYMMNPDGSGGPELSIYLLRVWSPTTSGRRRRRERRRRFSISLHFHSVCNHACVHKSGWACVVVSHVIWRCWKMVYVTMLLLIIYMG
jgi:hypothetical protein